MINEKNNSYHLIFIIIDRFTKIVYYKLVKIIINILGLAKIIINIIIKYYSLSNLIITNQKFLFILKFWLLLYYFLSIK